MDTFDAAHVALNAPPRSISTIETKGNAQVYLAGVVSNEKSAIIDDDALFRSYSSVIATKTKVRGHNSFTENIVVYRVGRAAPSAASAINRILASHSRERIMQPFKMNEASELFLGGLARKYSNFSGRYVSADFSGVLEILSAGVASYATFGVLRHQDLMGGKPINIRALGSYDDPSGASDRVIFVPRAVARGVFCAIVAAANAVGTTVATDMVHLDANSNAPVVTMVDGVELAMGCCEAIRLLLGIMDESNAGALGAYAVTRGMHAVLTVVGHTDEGAVMRDVLRASGFAPSYGGVYVSATNKYIGLPTPSRDRLASFVSLCDGLVLATAALVADCDPLVEYNGRHYPSIYGVGKVSTCESTTKAGRQESVDLAMAIAATCGGFCENYARGLARLFMVGLGEASPVVAHLQAAFNSIAKSGSRHLEYASVAPFYWIEPTSLMKERDPLSKACAEGYGTLAGVYDTVSMPYFEAVTVANASMERSSVIAVYRSARTCGLILHHQMNRNNGTGAVLIRQADPNAFAHRGGADETIAASMSASVPISGMLWQRGDAGVPAPSELLYTGEAVGLVLKHGRFDEEEFRHVSSGLCSQSEVASNQPIHISTDTPAFFGLRKIHERPRAVIRSRSHAIATLEAVNSGWRPESMVMWTPRRLQFSSVTSLFVCD